MGADGACRGAGQRPCDHRAVQRPTGYSRWVNRRLDSHCRRTSTWPRDTEELRQPGLERDHPGYSGAVGIIQASRRFLSCALARAARNGFSDECLELSHRWVWWHQGVHRLAQLNARITRHHGLLIDQNPERIREPMILLPKRFRTPSGHGSFPVRWRGVPGTASSTSAHFGGLVRLIKSGSSSRKRSGRINASVGKPV